jgi:hypothetical protein
MGETTVFVPVDTGRLEVPGGHVVDRETVSVAGDASSGSPIDVVEPEKAFSILLWEHLIHSNNDRNLGSNSIRGVVERERGVISIIHLYRGYYFEM